jgi:hypothetical protein
MVPESLRAWIQRLAIILFILGTSTCTRSAPAPGSAGSSVPTKTPFQPVILSATPTNSPTVPPPTATTSPTPSPYSIWVAPGVAAIMQGQLRLPELWGFSENAGSAALQLRVGEQNLVSRWVFALVAPFPTITDDISGQALHRAWKGETDAVWGGAPLLMAASTLEIISAYWGEPASESVRVIPKAELLDEAWGRESAWAIIPFEELSPRWKVISIDGISPLHKDYDSSDYELIIPISLVGGNPPEGIIIPLSNRHADQLTTLVMTGVTALVRATAYTMEIRSITYPGEEIANWLQEADIAHISNEVPFARDCPFPNPVQEGMRFCSADRYLELLEYIGTDIVELTGDHFADWGAEAMLHTLELYENEGWPVYGGGENLGQGRQAVLIEHNGNRLAFIGCNAKGGSFAQASPSNPGAVACDFTWMQAEIERLRAEDYLPIVTFQHFEYYTYNAQPDQIRDGRAMTSAGAVIVSGSQAHHPQALEFSNGGLIHHGLGNLFFDQFDVSPGTIQGFIDRHVFYDERHISTELLTIQFVDYAKPRPMTLEERVDLLQSVFQASGW